LYTICDQGEILEEWVRQFSLFPSNTSIDVWCKYPIKGMVGLAKQHVKDVVWRSNEPDVIVLPNDKLLKSKNGAKCPSIYKSMLVTHAMLICATWLNAELERISRSQNVTTYDNLCRKMGLNRSQPGDLKFLDLVLFMVDEMSHSTGQYLRSAIVRDREHYDSMPSDSYFRRAETFGYEIGSKTQFVDHHAGKFWADNQLLC
jgi:hypothetical protein